MDIDISAEKGPNSKKRRVNVTCFVPKCYKSNIEKKSLFKAPKDAELLQKWRTLIPRKDKELSEYDVVCEKHFKDECIARFYRHVINGEEVLVPRGKPKLLDGALPTEYPDHSSYYTKKLPQKRNPKCREPDAKKARIEENIVIDDNYGLFSDPKLPSEFWSKIRFQTQKHVYAFALYSKIDIDMPVLKPERLVVVKELENGTAYCSIYVNGCRTETDKVLYAVSELQNLLNDVSTKALCKGAGSLNEFSGMEVSANDFHIQGNLFRHKLCKGVVDITLSICLKCKCARKRMLDKRSKQKAKKSAKNLNLMYTKYNSCLKTKNALP